jgi:GntR family transcriptional regulator
MWFAPSSEVPIYRQMVTQVVLAILSGKLKAGDRLPSTRELARRFGLHPNTVSAGYRQLEREGWTEHRHGSGVYVRGIAQPAQTPEQILDQHIAAFFRAVRELQLPAAAVRARVAEWLAAPEPDHFLLIDPDPQLRQILLTELEALALLPTRAADPAALTPDLLRAAVPLCRPSQTALVRAALPIGTELTTLPIRSANKWLAARLPATGGLLIAIVSHWPEFVLQAQAMLIAAGIDSDALLCRDARKPRWQRGLEGAAGILCDAYTARHARLPANVQKVVFPLLAENAADELHRFTRL